MHTADTYIEIKSYSSIFTKAINGIPNFNVLAFLNSYSVINLLEPDFSCFMIMLRKFYLVEVFPLLDHSTIPLIFLC